MRCCRECGARLRGRSDKRFCGDFCRNSFHNRRNRETNRLVGKVNQILRRNYRILKWALKQGEGYRITAAGLLRLGFNHQWYTRMVGREKGREAFLVYDLLLLREPDGAYTVRRFRTADATELPNGRLELRIPVQKEVL